MNTEINAKNAPAAIGPYSQAIVTGERTVYVSGQLPVNPDTGVFAGEDVTAQTRQSIENIRAVLKEAGAGLTEVVMTNVYLKDMKDFGAMNEVYAAYFTKPFPARVAVEVAALPKGALVEISAIAKI